MNLNNRHRFMILLATSVAVSLFIYREIMPDMDNIDKWNNIDNWDIGLLPRGQMPTYKQNLSCENVMTNLPNGRWIHWSRFASEMTPNEYKKLENDERQFDNHMKEFRIKRGIHTRLWREDLKCGLKNLQTKPEGRGWGGKVGAWCDARSKNPCCSNENDGTCGMNCTCAECVDMRDILHAEFARRLPHNESCKWTNYTAKEACRVVRKFSEIHVVGDSFIKKMSRVLILLLRNDRNHGVVVRRFSPEMRNKCVADDQLYWSECRLHDYTFKEILVDQRPLCGIELSRFFVHGEYGYDAGDVVTKLVKTGKPGSLILLGVGAHMLCNGPKTFRLVLQPVVEFLNSTEKSRPTRQKTSKIRWPLIIFMFPETPDVLKSVEHRHLNGKIPCNRFTDNMIQYLEYVGIPYLDFREVTAGVHSYDGTHHGIGVNLQKLQILFNYLDSLELGID